MNTIYTCCFMQMAQNSNLDKANDIPAQFDEFRTILSDFLYGDDGYFAIDTTLKDVLFLLSTASKSKKKY